MRMLRLESLLLRLQSAYEPQPRTLNEVWEVSFGVTVSDELRTSIIANVQRC